MLVNTPSVSLGWQASPFLLPDADGNKYSFDPLYSATSNGDQTPAIALQGENGLLVAFICNHCPYVKAIGNRLAEDALSLNKAGINVVAINSNDFVQYPADNPENMKLFAKQYNFTFPYLVDEDQSIARAYDAVCTPDFFGFDKDGKLQYRGRLDNARMGSDANRTPELVNAMLQMAETGATQVEQIASMGCSIKWK